jgi:hypothetical protein
MSLYWRVWLFRASMIVFTLWLTAKLAWDGYDFYQTPLEERFYHPQYKSLHASGLLGHGYGIIGTILIAIGVFGYIYAKKTLRFEKFVRLKYLLEFHIFLCTVGPILVLYHTTFKFGGIVSIGFWSMVLVVASGVVGRYIYIQIPRSLNGKSLDLQEIESHLQNLLQQIKDVLKKNTSGLEIETHSNHSGNYSANTLSIQSLSDAHGLTSLKKEIQTQILQKSERKKAIQIISKLQRLNRQLKHLEKMQKWFSYWHVFHKPFAIIMLVIVIVHIIVTLLMGYTWIF